MALSARVAIIGTEESFQVLFGDLPKNQSTWVWGEVTACRVPVLKGLSYTKFPERMEMLVLCILSGSLNDLYFKSIMLEVEKYFEQQGKVEVNVGVILATNTHITTYGLTRMLAYHPYFQHLHNLGRFQTYERGAPLIPLLVDMNECAPLYLLPPLPSSPLFFPSLLFPFLFFPPISLLLISSI
eukprot:Phypoly_transcript_13815.p1 GENE.Phypoly_transcript_13815~~Phypoly_transcript_13815.p1  ORF type:complete len:184 (+),score=23.22 Phypoly_transcript_13815:119-670(+)